MHMCMCVRVRVRVCVRARVCVCARARVCVCVCSCVTTQMCTFECGISRNRLNCCVCPASLGGAPHESRQGGIGTNSAHETPPNTPNHKQTHATSVNILLKRLTYSRYKNRPFEHEQTSRGEDSTLSRPIAHNTMGMGEVKESPCSIHTGSQVAVLQQ